MAVTLEPRDMLAEKPPDDGPPAEHPEQARSTTSVIAVYRDQLRPIVWMTQDFLRNLGLADRPLGQPDASRPVSGASGGVRPE